MFGGPMEKTTFHSLLTGRPFALILAASVAVVALFGTLGWSLGTRLPGSSETQFSGDSV